MCFNFIGFFEKSNNEIIKYTENIDNLFFTKICYLAFIELYNIFTTGWKNTLVGSLERLSLIYIVKLFLVFYFNRYLERYKLNKN